MKYTGAHTIHDCRRTIKAVADAQGRILFIAPESKKATPPRGNPRRGQKQNKMYMLIVHKEGEKVNGKAD